MTTDGPTGGGGARSGAPRDAEPRPRTPGPAFTRPWSAIGLSTTALAVCVGLGPVLGLLPTAVAFVVWAASIVYFVVVTVGRRIGSFSVWHWLFAAGVGVTVLRCCALGLVQLVDGRPALFWNVDARYFTALAQGISRFGGVGDSIDYAGERLEYHAAQSWIAGALHHTVGVPINVSLFLVVPAFSVVLLAVGAYRLLRSLGLPSVPTLVAVTIGLSVPGDPVGLARAALRADRRGVIGSAVWLEGSGLAVAVFWLAVAFTAAWLVVGSERRGQRVISGACLASLVAIKPQYFLAVAVISAVVLVVQARGGRRRTPWSHLALWAVGTGLAAVVFSRINPEESLFSAIEIRPLDGFRAIVHAGRQPYFAAVYTIAVVTVLVVLLVPQSARRIAAAAGARTDLRRSAVGIVGASLAIAFFLGTTTFLIREDLLRQPNALGLNMTRAFHDRNLNQIMVPLIWLVVMLAVGLVTVLLRSGRTAVRAIPGVLAVVAVLAPLPAVFETVRNPVGSYAHEWTDEAALRDLMQRVDATAGLWLSSDLADSAEDFARPLRMVNVSALGPAQFYVANVPYVGWTHDDVRQRIEQTQRFFETPWSDWHERFLRRHGIGYVIVRDRCPPAWSVGDFPGSVVGSEGDWTLLAVGGTADPTVEDPWPSFEGSALYGQSACLSGRTGP